MSVKAIKCPSCGSPKVVEFKLDNFICGHCDTKFKWDNPKAKKVSLEKQTCKCGCEASAKCVECGTPLCTQHKKTLLDTILPEARVYFTTRILPAMSWQEPVDNILCVDCFNKKSKDLNDKVESLKNNNLLCNQIGCFSMELLNCDSCHQTRYCSQHTPIRKKYKKSVGLFGAKQNAVTYERICVFCYNDAKTNQKSVYWE